MKPVIIGVSGLRLTREERALLRAHGPRGVILFARNIQNKTQLSELVGELRASLPIGAVLMVDQEGGRVARLRAPHWPEFPAARHLQTPEAAYAQGLAIGEMAKAAGFDVVAAPVLDVPAQHANEVIGDRAFSEDENTVAALGGRMAAGLVAAGVIPVMKHIPGHGRARVDSHLELPVVLEPNLTVDFWPFQVNRDIPWAMTAHVVYAAYDAARAGTLSPVVIKELIRGRIGFNGVLVSDDLAMGALTGSPAERAKAALAAGCDIALYCPGDIAGNEEVLEALN